MSTSSSLRDELDGPCGYSLQLSLSSEELAHLERLIERQWIDRLRSIAPQHVDAFAATGLARYHERAHLVDHGSIWPKAERVLPAAAVEEIRALPFVGRLAAEFGEFAISDEDQIGREEVYWRLVRPRQANDVGPLHADGWFWELNRWPTPPATRRVKVWIAIHTEVARNGLRVVPGSHLRQWRYHGEQRHGYIKPQLDESEDALPAELVPMQPGQAIVFHDKLVHGGAVNDGERTRVSLEFTMFVDA